MSPTLITSVVGLAIAVMTISQVVPSISNTVNTQKSEIGVSRETSLVQQILQYRNVEGSYPATVADLVSKSYWRTVDNDNGFGGAYTFTIDSAKGLVVVSTTISDAARRTLYIANKKHVFKPIDTGGGVLSTTFILPSLGALASNIPNKTAIPATPTPPNASTNSYWYDTSGATAVLKVSNGSTWVATAPTASSAGAAAPNAANIVGAASALPTTATAGDVRYIFNATTSTLDTLLYYNGNWVQAAAVNSTSQPQASKVLALATETVNTIGQRSKAFSLDLTTLFSVKSFPAGTALTYDSTKLNWSYSGTLPAGLSLSAAGVISGTPTARTTTAGLPIDVFANYEGLGAKQTYALKVKPEDFQIVPSSLKSAVTFGGNYNCAITTTGGAKCWGENASQTLGDGSNSNKPNPTDVTGLTSGVASVFVDQDFACAITTGGSARCWGNGLSGNLGNSLSASSANPVQVTGLTTGVASMDLAAATACAVTTAGAVKCWGANQSGHLGDGTTVVKNAPVQVVGLTSGISTVKLGVNYGCALSTAGGVKCWGQNDVGQLGNGTLVNSSSPVQVTGLTSGVTSISLGTASACARLSTGALMCWGSNTSGQLGTGDNANKSVPTQVVGLASGVASVTLAKDQNTTCAVTTAGGLKCWGSPGFNSSLGNGTTGAASNIPVDVTGLASGVTSVKIGSTSNCALLTSGGLKCWGFFMPGNGSVSTPTTTPVDVTGMTSGVGGYSLGNTHACAAFTATGQVKCWGQNTKGQLGDGTITNSSTPVTAFLAF